MRAGKLRTLARIQRRTATGSTDAANRPTYTWATLKEVWADLQPLTAGEAEQARSIMSTASYRMVIRQRDWTPQTVDRVYLPTSGKTLEIGGVLPDQMGRDMVLICGEAQTT